MMELMDGIACMAGEDKRVRVERQQATAVERSEQQLAVVETDQHRHAAGLRSNVHSQKIGVTEPTPGTMG
jgi:hypothetical protein